MIRIGKMTDYGIVLLSYFAKDSERPVLNARDLAVESCIPLPTVSKILKVLSRGELLVSQRGANGGYRLAKPPHEISVSEIIAKFEGPIAMTECNAHDGLCELEPMCPVTANWRKINHVVRNALDGLTLADMAQPISALRLRGK